MEQDSKSITVSGVTYESIEDMQKALGINGNANDVESVLEELIGKGYIQQLDGSFLKIR